MWPNVARHNKAHIKDAGSAEELSMKTRTGQRL
jgi:hypothetical protein